MREQVLDSMELERERGITIKMQPVRMEYKHAGQKYILNLIDTPGHIDFSYEVSRALKAVEGSILLVDATQGVQAQTLTTLGMARESGLTIIPVLSKVDSPLARIEGVAQEMIKLLGCTREDIIETSGKTGVGVETLLQRVIEKIPSPKNINNDHKNFRALVFDFKYSNHTGVIVFVRVMDGVVKKHTDLRFKVAESNFKALEMGIFSPTEIATDSLSAGEIGYIVTGVKEPGIAKVGDTITLVNDTNPPLPGYMDPRPVVWASIYPESQDDFALLKQALLKLKLSDSSFTFEEESSGTLGRGFKCGFLGMLHLEIITERLRREFDLELVATLPSITYEVEYKNGKRDKIYSAPFFPDDSNIKTVYEPWVNVVIITPIEYLGVILQILHEHEGRVGNTETFGDSRTSLSAQMPLRELMRGFFDKLKSASSGYASISYEIEDMKEADVVKMEILIADEPVPAFARIVSRKLLNEEAEKAVEKLYTAMPRQMIVTKIQAKGLGRIIASRTLSAMRKDVTQHMYGGDITRKMKLREKQKKGKKKMQARGKVNIPQDVFLKMMRSE